MNDVLPDSARRRLPTPSLGLSPLSRVRFDALLQEMLDRVGDVMLSRERLRRLLDAVVSISSRLDLRTTLRQLIEVACGLVDARYGALGVIGPDRQLTDFITHGLDGTTHTAFSALPRSRGVLGLVNDEARAVRMPSAADHAGGAGRAADQPRSFLGVPIRIGDQVFGHLYLAEKQDAREFTEDDEEIVVALAAAAGVAIENARLYATASRREQWQAATAEITSVLLGTVRRTDALSLVARRAREVAEAELAIVLLYDEERAQFTVEVVDHRDGHTDLTGAVLPVAATAIAETVIGRRQIAVETLAQAAPWPVPVTAGPTVVSPLAAGDTLHGLLIVARGADQPAQPAEDLSLLASFAAQAALAMERVRAQDEREMLAVLEDRGRIARDLHDVVIQRLFATGLQLQSAGPLAMRPEAQNRINAAVDDLDATIRDIRRAIFELRTPARAQLRVALHDTVRAAARGLGFMPRVRLSGPVDSAVPEVVRGDLQAVLQEALSNATRHAACRNVEVELDVNNRVTLTVTDDGVGIGPAAGGSGLVNLAERARRHGGEFTVEQVEPQGTRIRWSVPVTAAVAAPADEANGRAGQVAGQGQPA